MATTKSLNIYQRILAVKRDVAYVQKEDKKVNNQYRFVSHDAVTAKVRPALIEHGIVILTENIDRVQNGNRCEVTVTYRIVNADDPNDFAIAQSCGAGISQQDKGEGKALSYSYKYLLLKTFALETGDDPERELINHQPDQQQASVADNLFAHFTDKMGSKEEAWKVWTFLCEQFGVTNPKFIPEAAVPEFAKFINRDRAAIQADMMGGEEK